MKRCRVKRRRLLISVGLSGPITWMTLKDGTTVTYENEFRGRKQMKPVLPSDHFGLLVTLKPK